MKPLLLTILFVATISAAVGSASATARTRPRIETQEEEVAARIKTRDRLERLLKKVGPTIGVTFAQSKKQPFNYVGSLTTGLVNAKMLEIVVSVTPKDTISFRIYPHLKGRYINVDQARDPVTLMRTLLRLSDRAFFYWGVDETGDVFTGYTLTLESGFPEEAITIVLRSIPNSDEFVGELRPSVEPLPTAAPKATRPKTTRPRRPLKKQTVPEKGR